MNANESRSNSCADDETPPNPEFYRGFHGLHGWETRRLAAKKRSAAKPQPKRTARRPGAQRLRLKEQVANLPSPPPFVAAATGDPPSRNATDGQAGRGPGKSSRNLAIRMHGIAKKNRA